MSAPMSQDVPPASASVSVRIGRIFRRYFVTGLATLFPVTVTGFVLWHIFQFTDRLFGRWFGFTIPGLGLVVTLGVILLVGIFTIHFFGRLVFHTLEVALLRLPLVRKVYPPVKQLAQFLFDEQSRSSAFRRVVLVQYPRAGLYSIAFVTNESKTTATGKQETLLTCLIPNPPSPFTGPIIFVPEADIMPLDLSVEDAVKLIVSGGVVASPLKARASAPAGRQP